MNGFKSIQARRARSAVWAVFAGVLASFAVSARAASYDISGGIQFLVPQTVLLDSYSLAGPISISRQVLYDDVVPGRSWHGRAGSGADGYGLHASTYVGANNIANGDSGGLIFSAFANVLVTYTDFVITGPVGSGPVQAPINFHLGGEQILGSYTSSSPIYISHVSSNVSLSVSAGNNAAGGGNFFYYRNGVSSPPTQTGMLVGFGSNPHVQTPLWTLPVNTPFTVQLSLYTAVQVGVVFSDGYITSALSDFGGTLSFATDRPVFGLPAGYSVNSVDAGIVDNVFTTPVPEPGTAALAVLGVAVIGGWARRRRIAAAAAASLLPLLAAAPAHAEVWFTVTNLGTLGGLSSAAYAINASGQVAGTANRSDGSIHATRWTNGVAQDLGTAGGFQSFASGINDAGQVADEIYFTGNPFPRARIWAADGTPSVLPISPADRSSGLAINNSGTVVGYAYLSAGAGVYFPVLWRNGVPVRLDTAGYVSFARAINNAGQVVGTVNSSAAFWQSETAQFRLLPGLGGTGSSAFAINSAGMIAGFAIDAAGRERAVVWQGGNGSAVDIGSLAGGSTRAIGISDRGEVIGLSGNQGFWRSAAGMVNLDSMLAPGSGATRTLPGGINVYGQIAGSASIAGQTRAVLLTPTGSVAWQGGAGSANGSFADATRWEQGFVPSKFVDASIDSPGLQTVFVNQAGSVKNLALGANTGSPGRPTLSMTGGHALQVAGLLTVQGTGTLAGDGVVAGDVLNRGTVLPTNLTVTGSFNNEGLVAGRGTLNAALANNATGQVRSGAGDLLLVSGTSHSNAGTLDIRAGGEQQYSGALANAAGGRILLNDAVLRLNNGATNAGQVQVSFGGATVYGSVATTAGGKVILSGNSQTTFFDAVSVDSGGEVRVSNGSTGVFFGPVTQRTGALFTGTGTKFFEGGLSIGASPGLGLDAGSVNFGVGNLYTAEIGGTTACTAACETDAALRDSSFDQYIVAGHLGLGGTLKLVSWAGFTGQIGQSFDLFDWGSSSGGFSSIDASALVLANGALLDTSQLYTAGVVRVTAVPEPCTWALLLAGLIVVSRRLHVQRQNPITLKENTT